MLGSKKVLRPLAITSVIFAQSSAVLADPVSQDLKSCATAALAERQQTARSIIVDDNGHQKWELDHSKSSRWNEYKILITGKKIDYCVVTCKISNAGKLISASFDR